MPIPTTVSTCTVETEQGKHVFRIVGYSHYRGLAEYKRIRSGIFSVGGHNWGLAFGREGVNSEIHPDCVLVALMILGKGSPKARASYELRLVDQITGLPFSVHKEAPRTFDPDGHSKISVNRIERNVVEASNYLRDDCLILECIITVIRAPATPRTKLVPKIVVPPSDIAAHFAKLLEEKEGVDVVFSVGAETFTAHKIVLATRSPVFKAEFYGPMSKAGTERMTIKDLQPDVFRALLYFIYSDSLPAMDDLEGDDRIEI